MLWLSLLLGLCVLPHCESKENFNIYAFAAIKDDGSLVTWGTSYFGGDSSVVAEYLENDVAAIYSTQTVSSNIKSQCC